MDEVNRWALARLLHLCVCGAFVLPCRALAWQRGCGDNDRALMENHFPSLIIAHCPWVLVRSHLRCLPRGACGSIWALIGALASRLRSMILSALADNPLSLTRLWPRAAQKSYLPRDVPVSGRHGDTAQTGTARSGTVPTWPDTVRYGAAWPCR